MEHRSHIKLVESQHAHLTVSDLVYEEYVYNMKMIKRSKLRDHCRVTGRKPSFNTSFKNGIIGKCANSMDITFFPENGAVLFKLKLPFNFVKFLKMTCFKLHFGSDSKSVLEDFTEHIQISKDMLHTHWIVHVNYTTQWTEEVDYIKLEFILVHEVPSKNINLNKELRIDVTDSQLSKYYLSDELSDVTFECDNEIIPAHRFALSSKSPVFATMLTANMKEANEGCIKIDDMDLKTLKEFLKVFYDIKINSQGLENVELTRSLLIAAEKYQMQLLKDQCEQSIIHTCCAVDEASAIKMFIDFYYLADTYEVHQLKDTALDYLTKKKKAFTSSVNVFTEYVKNYPSLMMKLFEG